ncbi:FAD-binding protein [Roseateles sp.]|uniref:FAD-dependent oxidoreductase n=1 Tax=Roseateles sp. TaxID=1971397 RepID=UPI003D14AD64
MDRRRFLAWGGVGGLAATGLPGCGGGGASVEALPPPPPAPAPTPAPAPPGPEAAEWQRLAGQLQGQLLRPGDAAYESQRLLANARYDALLRPAGLVRCAGAADVSAALAFARRNSLTLTPRSGGHSYLGASSGPGLVIDVGPMNSVRLDGEIAVVGAGATLADVYEGLLQHGRCIPSGSCLSVGITGITLGGGFGVLDRAHGLSCDALVGAKVVNAEGQTLVCDAGQNSDLFWALRGGGGGQFGIVTELRFQTHAEGPLLQFSASFPLDDLEPVLAAWQRWPEQGLPDSAWSQLAVSPVGGRLWGLALGTHSEAAQFAPIWQALLTRINRSAVVAAPLQTRSYREVLLGDCSGLSLAQCHLPAQNPAGLLRRVAMAASSDFFDQALPAEGLLALAQALRARRGQGSGGVILNLMGGAIARVPAQATAFAHRAARFSAQYGVELPPFAGAAAVEEGAAWAHGLRQLMQPWSSGRAYLNYPDAAIAQPLIAYHGAHLARLQQIKQAQDPAGVFKTIQGL